MSHSIHGGETYYYYFSHRASQQTWPSWMGVLHGYEINFIFGEPYNNIRYKYTSEEKELASRFMRYWANFARTGYFLTKIINFYIFVIEILIKIPMEHIL